MRDFALLICDKVNTATYKAVYLSGSSDAQDGWLIQGLVANSDVTSPMYMIVSNLNLSYSAFFRAIPYGGPEVQVTGPNPNSTVSGVTSLLVSITDLSGTTSTNQQLIITVNGLPARYALGPNNGIALDTRYAPSGTQEIEVTVGSVPVAFDPQNPPIDTKLQYIGTATLTLDFQNAAFVVNPSSICSPEIGTNYILFGVNQASEVQAVISSPSDGRVLASYSGYVPTADTVAVPWNFTEADGVTAYAENSYAVAFAATGSPALNVTNLIDRQGVRGGAGTILTYAHENTATDPTGLNAWCNAQADTWIGDTLAFLYNDMYDQLGFTAYHAWQVGIGRNITAGYINTPYPQNGWREFMQEKLGSMLYSDATIGPMHGSGTAFGAFGPTGTTVSANNISAWTSVAGGNWRMRKVALWSCYSAVNGTLTNLSGAPTFPLAFGIRSKALQDSNFMKKNAGLFWAKGLEDVQGRGWSIAEVAASFDQAWVCGPNAWPGACDPTWAIARTLNDTLRLYPALTSYGPVLAGYWWLPYSDVYDNELMGNNLTHVHR